MLALVWRAWEKLRKLGKYPIKTPKQKHSLLQKGESGIGVPSYRKAKRPVGSCDFPCLLSECLLEYSAV